MAVCDHHVRLLFIRGCHQSHLGTGLCRLCGEHIKLKFKSKLLFQQIGEVVVLIIGNKAARGKSYQQLIA